MFNHRMEYSSDQRAQRARAQAIPPNDRAGDQPTTGAAPPMYFKAALCVLSDVVSQHNRSTSSRRTSPRTAKPSPMLVSVVAATVFAELGIGVSIHSNGEWRSIHLAPTINDFELEHGSEAPRWDYNGLCMEMARATE